MTTPRSVLRSGYLRTLRCDPALLLLKRLRQLLISIDRHPSTTSSWAPAPVFLQQHRAKPVSRRSFTSAPFLQKKINSKGGGKGKHNTKHEIEEEESSKEDVDPSDMSVLQASIQKATDKLKEDLSKLRGGGRLDPLAVEKLRVFLTKGDPKSAVPLRDVANVVPKGGRLLTVLVLDQDVRTLNHGWHDYSLLIPL
jgi:ribosome recycling factor